MGFGMTTVLLNLHNVGLFPLGSMILAVGIFYGGLAQVIAGIMEWKNRHITKLHLVAGVLMLLVGIVLLLGWV